MRDYRQLTKDEILVLEQNACWAEDWNRVLVADDFRPYNFHRVIFYGDIRLGAFHKQVEVSRGFFKHSGINDATLRNVSVGNDCLIEKVGNFINNYTIGDDCYISNISTMETLEGASYGAGSTISVLNEMGDGNVTLFRELNSQLAALMVKHSSDKQLTGRLRQLIDDEVRFSRPDRGTVGNRVKIINTKDITNTVIKGDCEINGASRLADCTILSSEDASVYIGTGVICENSIICDGCSINNSVKMQDCFVGEACQITNGFTAEASLFFANSFMANGEACAAFCGPFSASHHKSSLLIGGQFSFYNAGSNTNFSNHAYKMGPLHWGTLERGTKTASGSYVLMPATIGAFSVCFGKLMHHPDTRNLPFSYLIAYGETMYLVPGRNITTVGLYRDIKKWPKRDKRSKQSKKSIINFDWLSPFTVGEILQGIKVLEDLRHASGDNVTTYNFHEYVINASSLQKGRVPSRKDSSGSRSQRWVKAYGTTSVACCCLRARSSVSSTTSRTDRSRASVRCSSASRKSTTTTATIAGRGRISSFSTTTILTSSTPLPVSASARTTSVPAEPGLQRSAKMPRKSSCRATSSRTRSTISSNSSTMR